VPISMRVSVCALEVGEASMMISVDGESAKSNSNQDSLSTLLRCVGQHCDYSGWEFYEENRENKTGGPICTDEGFTT
jgi:hypothetical protein